MTEQYASTTQGDARPRADTVHFLPDLCAPQAVLVLVLVAELLALLLAIVHHGLAALTWDAIALYSFQLQWVVLVSAVLLCRLKPCLNRLHPVRAGALSYGLVLMVTLVFSLLGQWLLSGFSGTSGSPLEHWQRHLWQLAENLLTAAILAGIGLRYLYLQQQLRNQQRAELDARIQALQSRIRPHFLFNSLNSIASLIPIAPEKAERAVEDLASLFRASLAEPALIPAAREIDLCRDYLALEQLRLGKRLQVEWHLDELPEDTPMPALLMQPLLENAVLHGIEPLPGGGTIDIQVARSGSQVAVRISNPLPNTTPPEPGRHNRMALDNIRHRLHAHFGPTARLSTRRDDGRFTLLIVYAIDRLSNGASPWTY